MEVKNLVKNMSIRQTQSDITSQYNEFKEGTQSSAQPIIYVTPKKKFKMHVISNLRICA
jgi:hypothetical protein